MQILLELLIGGFLLATIIVTWVNRSAIGALEDEIAHLRAQLRQLKYQSEPATPQASPDASAADAAPTAAPAASVVPPEPYATAEDWGDAAPVAARNALAEPADAAAAMQHEPPLDAVPTKPSQPHGFEQFFGARLMVWCGGLALIFSGFFLVRFWIDNGLLTPGLRVMLGLAFGGALLGLARWLRSRNIAAGTRIAQALAGAGIADLYICLFAAVTLYDLAPAWLGFGGMALVTALAVFLALEHGVPIALLGLMGGFFTPALINTGHPSAALLFSYLYLLLAGFLFVIRQQGWWFLALPAMLGSFLWVAVWLFGGYFMAGDGLWLGLFLLAISATAVVAAREQVESEDADAMPLSLRRLGQRGLALQYGAMGGAILGMSLVTGISGFTPLEWGLFGLLSLGAIALAFFNQRLYGLLPWLALITNGLMLLSWRTDDAGLYALVAAGFAALFAVSGHLLQARSEKPLLWSGLLTAAGLGYYLIAYFKLRYMPEFQSVFPVWGALALLLAGAVLELLRRLWRQIPPTHPQRAAIISLYAATVTAFLSIALTIELQREFLSVAFAAEVLVLAWLQTRFRLPALRWLAAGLALCFAAVLVPQILLIIQLTAFSLVELQLGLQASVPLVQWPLFQLGVPALAFAGASILLRRGQDDAIARGLEIAAIMLIGVMGYYLSRHAFHPGEAILFIKAGFGERGTITNVFFLFGLVCLAVGLRYQRGAVAKAGLVLAGVALFRIGYFDLLRYNPLWAAQDVGAWPLLNRLWLPYGLPVIWLLVLRQRLLPAAFMALRPWISGAVLFLAFTFVTLQYRQLWHGAQLGVGATTDAEIYGYSVVWLLFGIALLALGTWRQTRLLRIASLVVMLLAVSKVFLYDAAALTGLLRFFSFFGLGLCLMGLSWFYARFVFRERGGVGS